MDDLREINPDTGLPIFSEILTVCGCSMCSAKFFELCELESAIHNHQLAVATLLANSDHRMIKIVFRVGDATHTVSCHSSIICYWSGTIRSIVEDAKAPVRRISVSFPDLGSGSVMLGKLIVQWCYSAKLFDAEKASDVEIGCKDDIEALWNMAARLEMKELANFCMRVIISKYRWGYTARREDVDSVDYRDSPFAVEGPLHVYKYNRNAPRFHKLFDFMEDLLLARGPLPPAARANATESTIQGWEQAMSNDAGFATWINGFGGLEHNNTSAPIPTYHDEWPTYFMPASDRSPMNVKDWAAQHSAKIRAWKGKPLVLAGACDYGTGQWDFLQVSQ